MNQMEQKLLATEIALSGEHGDFRLFALLSREDVPGKWDLVASAPWGDVDGTAALKLLIDKKTIIGDVETLSKSLEEDWMLAPFQIDFPSEHDLKSLSLQFTSEVLGIYWKSRTNDMRNKFEYEVAFSAPDGSVALSIAIQPAFERIEIFFRRQELGDDSYQCDWL